MKPKQATVFARHRLSWSSKAMVFAQENIHVEVIASKDDRFDHKDKSDSNESRVGSIGL